MKKRGQTQTQKYTEQAIGIFALFVILACLAVFIPLNVALSAGLSAVGLVVFGAALAMLLSVILLANVYSVTVRSLLVTALLSSLAAMVIPQAYFYHVAQEQHVELSFDPVRYLHFSGDTTIGAVDDLVYKRTDGGDLRMALYRPSNRAESSPVVLLLHGGGWRYGSHLETGLWPEVLTKHGFTVASVEYRLSSPGSPTWDKSPQDIRDAVAYVINNAEALEVDPENISLMGQSAGGHLALLEAYKNPAIKNVVSLYSPIDLTYDYINSRDESSELNFIGGPPEQYPKRYQALNPATYVKRDSPKTLLVQGKRDDLVAWRSASDLSAILGRFHVPHELILLPFTGHSFENQQGGFATQIAQQTVLDFLKE